MSEPIRFWEAREPGDVLQVTLRFLRENAGLLLKSLLFIAGPVFATASVFGTFSPFVRRGLEIQDPAAFEMLSVDWPYIAAVVLNLFGSILAALVVYAYLRLYEADGPDGFGLDDVWGVTVQFLPRMTATMLFVLSVFMLSVVIIVIPCLGALAYLAGSVYFGVVAALALPMRMFEDLDLLATLRRCRDLTRGRWWPTFGVLFVATLLYAFPATLASTPLFVLFFQPGGPAAGSDLALLFASAGAGLCNAVLYGIPLLAVGFQYFSLASRRAA